MYVSLEERRLTFLKVRFCSGLYKECEIPLPAAPFCRAVELAAHWRRSELPFVALSIRPSVSNCCAHGSGLAPTVVPGDLFRRSRVFAVLEPAW
jgi:hypothetical protein